MGTTADEGAIGPPRRVGRARLAVGFGQGVAIYALIRPLAIHWLVQHGAVFSALGMVTAFVPLILLAGMGRMRPAVLAGWTAGATGLLAAIAAYGWWRDPVAEDGGPASWARPELWFAAALALYVLHHLIEPADEARTLSPPYSARFEGAWRHGFQLAVSFLFTGVFWGVLQLGAGLFELIGVKTLSTLLRQSWFMAPATATVFAAAVHLTDVRPGLIRGVRTVGLTLLAWLLPLMAALVAAFLFALLSTGLGPLWRTQRASVLLLSAAGVLVLLVNAAYQDGREPPARVPGWAGRLAALLLPVLALLSAWAAGLRIAQYGLTPERVAGAALSVVVTLYAVGYAAAAVRRGPWMRGLEGTNVAAAWTGVALLLLLLSPVLDPARLSVSDQTYRLQAGRLSKGGFDYAFLRFRAARFGREALARLTRSPDPQIAAQAERAQALTSALSATTQAPNAAEPAFSHARLLTPGVVLPDSFRRQAWTRADTFGESACLVDGSPCDLHLLDVDGDGRPEVLVRGGAELSVFAADADGRWVRRGDYRPVYCPRAKAALDQGELRLGAAGPRDLEAGGERLSFNPAYSGGCRFPEHPSSGAARRGPPSPPLVPASPRQNPTVSSGLQPVRHQRTAKPVRDQGATGAT